MAIRSTLVLATFLSISCGTEDRDKNDEELARKSESQDARSQSPQGGSYDTPLEWEGFHYDLYDSAGNQIPLNLTPSLLEEGKLIQSCKKGQTPYLDQCFDEIHIETSPPGFRLVKKNGEVFQTGVEISDEWISKFAFHETGSNTTTHTHLVSYPCKHFCPMAHFFPTPLKTYELRGKNYIKRLQVGTSYTFATRLDVENHDWLLNGTLSIKGKTFKLPVTKGDIQKAFPDMNLFNDIGDGKMSARLQFFYIGKWHSPNPSEQYLHSVYFITDEYKMREFLERNQSEEI